MNRRQPPNTDREYRDLYEPDESDPDLARWEAANTEELDSLVEAVKTVATTWRIREMLRDADPIAVHLLREMMRDGLRVARFGLEANDDLAYHLLYRGEIEMGKGGPRPNFAEQDAFEGAVHEAAKWLGLREAEVNSDQIAGVALGNLLRHGWRLARITPWVPATERSS